MSDILKKIVDVKFEEVAAAKRRMPLAGQDLPSKEIRLAPLGRQAVIAVAADAGLMPASTVTTFGAEGVAWDGEQLPGLSVPGGKVLDTTGAGDAFCGALCAALAQGADRAGALVAGQEAGAQAVQHEGAQPDGAL